MFKFYIKLAASCDHFGFCILCMQDSDVGQQVGGLARVVCGVQSGPHQTCRPRLLGSTLWMTLFWILSLWCGNLLMIFVLLEKDLAAIGMHHRLPLRVFGIVLVSPMADVPRDDGWIAGGVAYDWRISPEHLTREPIVSSIIFLLFGKHF